MTSYDGRETGLSPEQRVAACRKDVAPLVEDLIDWMKRERGKALTPQRGGQGARASHMISASSTTRRASSPAVARR
jgi:hypothetical protein